MTDIVILDGARARAPPLAPLAAHWLAPHPRSWTHMPPAPQWNVRASSRDRSVRWFSAM